MDYNIIEVEHLCQVYPNGVVAVDDISFTVAAGEIFGFLGPNGAGKSTTINVLTTLIKPTAGAVRVTGVDVARQPTKARQHIGYVSQDLAVDDDLTGLGNLRMQAGLYHIPRAEIATRIGDVLRMVGLTDRAGDLVTHYSGGMRKRLDIACGLIHRPRLLFLDEPTLGLDIQTRREIWKYITGLREEFQMTIFLTTHYMEEADALCDHVAIIDYGKIKAQGAPAELKNVLGGDTVEFRFEQGSPAEIERALNIVRELPGVKETCVVEQDRDYIAVVEHGETAVPVIFRALAEQPARIGTISLKRPSLDDVFLHYTGRQLRDTDGGGDAMRARVAMRRLRG
jgi:ABC-2 type transport system ATP-binding protein